MCSNISGVKVTVILQIYTQDIRHWAIVELI